ncbi:MAG: DNA polymerase I [Lactobacillaceae bacterium]|jgi:DNA polymerase-1|nr:DNA polymerase I [Lactobacillaceae bacterium]
MTKKICLIDGSGYIFRAFYALPPMTSPDGTPVNAVYGFTNMFFKLTSNIDCDYSLVLFDAKRKNFRNDIFPDYKANRAETPEDLIPQFPIIRKAVTALNINHLEMEGYEADDLIATYAKIAKEQGLEVIVVSADKDLMQLIGPDVKYYDPMKDTYREEKDVIEKFGVGPDRVVDVQALMGDSSDNIPGVPGIGPKTASELINQYGSLEGLLDNLDDIKQDKRRQTLKDNIENARISYQLASLKTDVPVEKNFDGFKCKKPEIKQVFDFIDEYAMKSLRPRAEKWVYVQCSSSENTAVSASREIKKKYELVQDEASLKKWVDMIMAKRVFAFDTETTGFSSVFDKIVGFSLAAEEGIACYIPLAHGELEKGENGDLFSDNKAIKQLPFDVIKKYLKPIFASKSVLKIGHNIKFDMHFISQVLGNDFVIEPIEDTAVISYVLDSSSHGHGMDELAELFLNYKTIAYDEVTGSGKNRITFDKVDLNKALDYAAEDADITLRLYNVLKPRLTAEGMAKIYEHFDRPLITTLKEMEDLGITVDVKRLHELKKEFEEKMSELEKEAYVLAGEEFNLASPKQVGNILTKVLSIKGKKTATGAMQTGASELEKLAEDYELPRKILDWRGFAKLKSTYTDSLLELTNGNNRVHTTYNQTFVNTGRLSSNNPNLQNIPIRSAEGKKIRQCFIPRAGWKIISSDYSQVELRLMAVIADVKALQEAFANGIDIHTATASQVFGVPTDKVNPDMRRDAKTINFGIIYGQSQYGLAKQLGISNEAAKAYIDAYFAKMPEIKSYMESTTEFARKNGYVITPFGRKISVLGINDQNKRIASFAERAAINAPLQGGASDIIKLAMNKIRRILKDDGYKTKMLLQVHDELVFEAPVEEVEKVGKMIKDVMENAVNFYHVKFVAEVGVGDNWEQAH